MTRLPSVSLSRPRSAAATPDSRSDHVRTLFQDVQQPDLIGSVLIWNEVTPSGPFSTTAEFNPGGLNVHTRPGGRPPLRKTHAPLLASAVARTGYTLDSASPDVSVRLLPADNQGDGLTIRPGWERDLFEVVLGELGRRRAQTGRLDIQIGVTLTRRNRPTSPRLDHRLILMSSGASDTVLICLQRLFFTDSPDWVDAARCQLPGHLIGTVLGRLRPEAARRATPEQEALYQDVVALMQDANGRLQNDASACLVQDQGGTLTLAPDASAPVHTATANSEWHKKLRTRGNELRTGQVADRWPCAVPTELRVLPAHVGSNQEHVTLRTLPLSSELLLLLERCLRAWQDGSAGVLVWTDPLANERYDFFPLSDTQVYVHVTDRRDGSDSALLLDLAHTLPVVVRLNRQYVQEVLSPQLHSILPGAS